MKITETTPQTAASGEWHLRIFAVRGKPLDQGQWKAHDAAQKLLFSAESIESVAAQTGFCDRFHLSRAFKTRFGLSPAAYRKNRTA